MNERRYPGAAAGVFRVSNSTIEQYLECGVYYEKALNLRHRRATVAMLIGSAVSEAAQFDNERKILGRRRLSDDKKGIELHELVDFAVHAYEKGTEESEVSEPKNEVDKGVDSTRGAARCYGEKVAPNIVYPVEAERVIIATIDDDIELAGTPDCIEDRKKGSASDGYVFPPILAERIVRDTKTGRAWTQERAAKHRQLTAYALLHEARMGKRPDAVIIDSISPTRKGWVAKSFWSTRTDEDCDAYVELVRRVRDAMRAGIALPAAAGSWKCSTRWCPFHAECEFFKGGK